MKKPAFVSLEDRISVLGSKGIIALNSVRFGEPRDADTESILIRMGLAYYIGGEAFITEMGRRVLSVALSASAMAPNARQG